MKKMIDIIRTKKFYYIIFSFYFFAYVIDSSMYSIDYEIFGVVTKFLRYICYAFFSLRIIFCGKNWYEKYLKNTLDFSNKTRILIITTILILFFSIVVNFILVHNTGLLILMLILISAMDICLDDIISVFVNIQLSSILFITTSCSFGLINNYISKRPDGGTRNAMGYSFPTNLSNYVFFFLILDLYKKRFKAKASHLMIVQLLLVFSYFITDSRTQLYMGEVVLIICILNNLGILKRMKSIILKIEEIFVLAFPFFPIFSALFAWCYKYGGVFDKLNDVLSNRLKQTYSNILDNGFPAFGKKITFIGNGAKDIEIYGGVSSNYVDNSYLRMMYNFGAITLICFMVLVFLCLVYFYSKKMHYQMFLSMLILIFALIYPSLLSVKFYPFVYIIIPTIIKVYKEGINIKMLER